MMVGLVVGFGGLNEWEGPNWQMVVVVVVGGGDARGQILRLRTALHTINLSPQNSFDESPYENFGNT